jgi:hypothetical protein
VDFKIHLSSFYYFTSSSLSLAESFPIAGAPGTAIPSDVLGDLNEELTFIFFISISPPLMAPLAVTSL